MKLHKGIVAYTAQEYQGKVIVHRSYADKEDVIETSDWDELVDFLTEDKGEALHICWSLYQFSTVIFSLLPIAQQREIDDKVRIYHKDTKIFYVDRILGLTQSKHIKGNFYSRSETNFYDIYRWLPIPEEMPDKAEEVEQAGLQVLEALAELGIYPDRLTSPVSILTDTIDITGLPTIWSCQDDLIDAMLYADKMAGYEWRTNYSRADKGIWYDLASAYPSFIADLPNTDHCKVIHSSKPLECDWGIMKGQVNTNTRRIPVSPSIGYYTTDEIQWLREHNAGTFELEDGYFIELDKAHKPYKPIIDGLLRLKATASPLVQHLAKQMSVGISGKLDQTNKDGSMGELYNPILAAMVRSRCRLAVADFIHDNELYEDLVAVLVDGVRATKDINLPETIKPGQWRKQV